MCKFSSTKNLLHYRELWLFEHRSAQKLVSVKEYKAPHFFFGPQENQEGTELSLPPVPQKIPTPQVESLEYLPFAVGAISRKPFFCFAQVSRNLLVQPFLLHPTGIFLSMQKTLYSGLFRHAIIRFHRAKQRKDGCHLFQRSSLLHPDVETVPHMSFRSPLEKSS